MYRKIAKINKFIDFFDFALYGRWEALIVCKILPQGALTISTSGKPNSENLFFFYFFPVRAEAQGSLCPALWGSGGRGCVREGAADLIYSKNAV